MSKLASTFFANAQKNPGKTAIYFEDTAISYKELADTTARWMTALGSQGVRRGDALGLLLPNGPDFAAVMLASAGIGAVLVPLNSTLPAAAIHTAFRAGSVKHVIGTAAPLAAIEGPDFSFLTGVRISTEGASGGSQTKEKLLGAASLDWKPYLTGQEPDPFILTMTSGSTGNPKPIVLTQTTKWNRAHAAIEMYGIKGGDVILAATPLYHSLAERLFLIPMVLGATSVLMHRYSASEWMKTVERRGVTFTIAVSAQLAQIAKLVTNETASALKTLRSVVSSSAKLENSLKTTLLSKLECDFHECYGTSEVAIASTLDVVNEREKLTSVGKPAPGVEIKILTEGDRLAAIDEPGEIAVRTPMIFGGYLKQPEATAQATWQGHFRTGDLGKIDKDGYLYYLGRKKELVISGGINIYPQDIEAVVARFPGVAECACFPVPDENLGEVVGVAVVSAPGTEITAKDLRHHCASLLADYQQPRKYLFLKELPKNEMGKTMKRLLPDVWKAEQNR